LNLSSFELIEDLIVIKCNVNGEDRKFMLDSSTPGVILNSKYQKCHKGNSFEIEEGSLTETISELKIDTLIFGKVKATNLFAVNMDLSHLEQSLDTEVYGVIGYEVLKDYNVYIDYQNSEIGLWNDEEHKTYIGEKINRSYKFEMERHLPIISCKVGGSTYHVALDTGANTNLFDINLKDELTNYMNVDKQEKMVGTVQDSSDISYSVGTMKTLEIAGLGEFPQMTTILSDIPYMDIESTVKIDGILGYQFLSQERFIICFTQNKLYVVQ